MRRSDTGGICEVCGAAAETGVYWWSDGVPFHSTPGATAPLTEEIEPVRCDTCELDEMLRAYARVAPECFRRTFKGATAEQVIEQCRQARIARAGQREGAS